MRMVFSPSYRQVLPGLDLSPSVGLGYGWGKSSAVGPWPLRSTRAAT